jgi:hypothetical protein
MIDPNETFLPLPHNGYLKVWSLGRPQLVNPHTGLPYDAILIDEAQLWLGGRTLLTRKLLSRECEHVFADMWACCRACVGDE